MKKKIKIIKVIKPKNPCYKGTGDIGYKVPILKFKSEEKLKKEKK